MKITATPRFGGTPYQTTLKRFAHDALDGTTHGQGQLEDLAATARNNSLAIGRLLAALVRKGTLGLDEIPGILGTLDQIEPAP